VVVLPAVVVVSVGAGAAVGAAVLTVVGAAEAADVVVLPAVVVVSLGAGAAVGAAILTVVGA
jgi:hypothetical protein